MDGQGLPKNFPMFSWQNSLHSSRINGTHQSFSLIGTQSFLRQRRELGSFWLVGMANKKVAKKKTPGPKKRLI